MQDFLEVLKYLLPALVVFFTAYFLIWQLLKREEQKQKLEILLNNQKQIISIRLQAYERLTLFLERINPESLVVRTNEGGMSNQMLQKALLVNIRQEYEHNLSQQLYVSQQTWELIRKAKESTVQLINTAAVQINPKNSSLELSKSIIEQQADYKTSAINKALDSVKEEVSSIFK